MENRTLINVPAKEFMALAAKAYPELAETITLMVQELQEMDDDYEDLRNRFDALMTTHDVEVLDSPATLKVIELFLREMKSSGILGLDAEVSRIMLIKCVRAITKIGLMEATNLVCGVFPMDQPGGRTMGE